jgi:hypothetical protein
MDSRALAPLRMRLRGPLRSIAVTRNAIFERYAAVTIASKQSASTGSSSSGPKSTRENDRRLTPVNHSSRDFSCSVSFYTN